MIRIPDKEGFGARLLTFHRMAVPKQGLRWLAITFAAGSLIQSPDCPPAVVVSITQNFTDTSHGTFNTNLGVDWQIDMVGGLGNPQGGHGTESSAGVRGHERRRR